MANQKLIEYIKQAREKGGNDDEIRKSLLGVGWPENEILLALNEVVGAQSPLPSIAPIQPAVENKRKLYLLGILGLIIYLVIQNILFSFSLFSSGGIVFYVINSLVLTLYLIVGTLIFWWVTNLFNTSFKSFALAFAFINIVNPLAFLIMSVLNLLGLFLLSPLIPLIVIVIIFFLLCLAISKVYQISYGRSLLVGLVNAVFFVIASIVTGLILILLGGVALITIFYSLFLKSADINLPPQATLKPPAIVAPLLTPVAPSRPPSQPPTQSPPPPQPPTALPQNPTVKTYTSSQFHYSLNYPRDWEVRELTFVTIKKPRAPFSDEEQLQILIYGNVVQPQQGEPFVLGGREAIRYLSTDSLGGTHSERTIGIFVPMSGTAVKSGLLLQGKCSTFGIQPPKQCSTEIDNVMNQIVIPSFRFF